MWYTLAARVFVVVFMWLFAVGFKLFVMPDADVGFMVCLTDADVAPADTAETENVSVRDAKERPRHVKKRSLWGRSHV